MLEKLNIDWPRPAGGVPDRIIDPILNKISAILVKKHRRVSPHPPYGRSTSMYIGNTYIRAETIFVNDLEIPLSISISDSASASDRKWNYWVDYYVEKPALKIAAHFSGDETAFHEDLVLLQLSLA